MVALSSLVGGGGGYSCSLPAIQVGTTSVWCPSYAGCVAVHVIGGGAGGNVSFQGGGGGSAGYTRKVFNVTTSDCYCMIIGSGGSAGQCGSCSIFCNISGTAVCLVSFPGCANSTACLGGGYGCSCGGDVNRCGSCGGCGGATSNEYGGGAGVNLFYDNCFTRTKGGNAGGGAGNSGAGGGGVGGEGAQATTSESTQPAGGGGGGSGGEAVNSFSCAGQNFGAYGGPPLVGLPPGEERFWSFIKNWGSGGSRILSKNTSMPFMGETSPGIGGGGAGTGVCGVAGQGGGLFGGGGGGCTGGPGGCGAGGGGGQCNFAAKGGNGVIFIEYLSVES